MVAFTTFGPAATQKDVCGRRPAKPQPLPVNSVDKATGNFPAL